MIELFFTKMHGAGNDFVVVNDFDGSLEADLPSMARALCAKGFGIGADGLLVVKRHPHFDFEMVYLNSDGSEGWMCGNGGRCIARFAVLNGICKSPVKFTAHGGAYSAEVVDDRIVKLYLPDPDKVTASLKIPVDSKVFNAAYVYPNTDHAVLFGGTEFEKVDTADLTDIGRKIRYNRDLFPKGTNVNLIEKEDGHRIRMRTYERGVENETLACGTGAVASAIAANIRYGLPSPVEVKTTGGEILKVYFKMNAGKYTNVVLEGSAVVVFQGKVNYDERANAITDLGHGHKEI